MGGVMMWGVRGGVGWGEGIFRGRKWGKGGGVCEGREGCVWRRNV